MANRKQTNRKQTNKSRHTATPDACATDGKIPLPGTPEWHVMFGVICVSRGFNVLGNPDYAWTFPQPVVERAQHLCSELVQLFHDSRLEPRLGAVMERDAEFQRFMGRINLG